MVKLTKVAKTNKHRSALISKDILTQNERGIRRPVSSASSLVPSPRVVEVVEAVSSRTVEGSCAYKAPGKWKGHIFPKFVPKQ